ncbi:MAG: LysR substrate-binding domain-containing protein [Tepidisphaeraceae bacterium]
MNRNHLAVFGAVAEAGSVSGAATKLLVSQPAVSLQVAELEKALGVKLLDRLPRGVRPTAAGRLLAGYASRIAALEEEADVAIKQLLGLVRGRLVVGASLTIGSYLAPGLLADFRAKHPDIDLELDVANTTDVQDRVARGEIEVGLTEGFAENPLLSADVFAHDELIVIAAPADASTGKRGIAVAKLAGRPMVLREPGSGTRAVFERTVRSRGVELNVAMSLGSTEAVKIAVARGIGWGVVSSLAVAEEVKAGTLTHVKLTDLKMIRDLHALTLLGRTLSPASAAFLEQVRGGVKK